MDYKLAKQLKDAGLQWEMRNIFSDTGSESRSEMYPTLSELIEACGDDFKSLVKHYNSPGMAGEYHLPWWEAIDVQSGEKYLGKTGKTPEEAVAKLWLELQS